MKKNTLLLLSCLFVLLANAQTNQLDTVDCTIDSFFLQAYGYDAKELAVREIYQTNNSYIDSVAISENSYLPILKDLTAIYKAGMPNLTDSIKAIHTFPIPWLDYAIVGFDTNIVWVKNLLADSLLSGKDSIDNLMAEYHLTVGNFRNWYAGAMETTIITPTPLNIRALANRFRNITGVKFAHEEGVGGDGSDITMNDSISFKEYIFRYGSGDCPSGCIHNYFWKFHVYPNCVVEYIGSGGYNWLIGTGIQPLSINNSQFSIYPNPASTSVTISIDESLTGTTATITDITGRKVATVQLNNQHSTINTESFATGVYFVSIGNATKKLVISK